MASVLQQYHQLADRMATQITGSYQSWTDFLTTAARLYKYPYHEQLMIYAQRPEATACADYELWNKRMGRYVRRGAKGIALIDHSPLRNMNVKSCLKGAKKMNELTYIRSGDYWIPNLILSQQENTPLGKYGRMRKKYLQEHRPVLWNRLILSEQLYPHLREIDETANRRLEQMMPTLMQSAGATEALKASDPMKWVGLMNNLKAQAEEVILTELIYT